MLQQGASSAEPTVPESLVCPECEMGPFLDLRGYKAHLRMKHGIGGQSAKEMATTRNNAPRKPRKTAGNQPESGASTSLMRHEQNIELPLAALGYAVGRLQSLAESIAEENGLPQKEFTTIAVEQLLELLRR